MIETKVCTHCGQTVPVSSEPATYIEGVRCAIKFLAPHTFMVGTAAYPCPDSKRIIHKEPNETS